MSVSMAESDGSWRHRPRIANESDDLRVKSIYDDVDLPGGRKGRQHSAVGRRFYDPINRRMVPRPSWGWFTPDPNVEGEYDLPRGLDYKYRDVMVAMMADIVNIIRGTAYDAHGREYAEALDFITARDKLVHRYWFSFDDVCYVCGLDPSATAKAIFEEPSDAKKIYRQAASISQRKRHRECNE